MRWLTRLAVVGAIGTTLLATGAFGFMTAHELGNGGTVFTFDVTETPQWILVTPVGTYRGVAFDSAKFGSDYALSFSDSISITLDDVEVEAQLKGKIDGACSRSRITLKDATNDRTVEVTSSFFGAAVTCTSIQ